MIKRKELELRNKLRKAGKIATDHETVEHFLKNGGKIKKVKPSQYVPHDPKFIEPFKILEA